MDEGKANANVGLPITATDDTPAHRGKLTYTVDPDTLLSINTSGQLKTKMPLDHEATPTFDVTVTATDPSGDSGTVTVTVTVNDVNEAPKITTGLTRVLDWNENQAITLVVATYVATDVDDDTLVWSLTGTDASDFSINNDNGELTFEEMPDYEKPAASNNLYRVTVEVSDGKLKATRPMTVMVTDVAEEGVVTLSTVAPRVAVPLTATLTDSDGGVKDVTWQWYDDTIDESNLATNAIDRATSATYTPVAGDFGRHPACKGGLHRPAWRTDRLGYSSSRCDSQQRQPRPQGQGRRRGDNRDHQEGGREHGGGHEYWRRYDSR